MPVLVAILIGAALFGRPLLALVVLCFRPDRVRSWFLELGPEAVERAARSRTQRTLVADLGGLGYRALGLKLEKGPLRRPVVELAFVSEQDRSYASISGRSGALYYYTLFEGGGFVLTSNGRFPRLVGPCTEQASKPNVGAVELLELHRNAVERFAARGLVAASVGTPEARLDATTAYYAAPEVRRALREIGLRTLAVLFGAGVGLALLITHVQ
jgi:hypothetical protein